MNSWDPFTVSVIDREDVGDRDRVWVGLLSGSVILCFRVWFDLGELGLK